MQLQNDARSHFEEEQKLQDQEQHLFDHEMETLTAATTAAVFQESLHRRNSTLHRFWNWTGIGKKSLLDLLQLAASIAIPITLGILSYQQQQNSASRSQQAQDLAEENQQHEILSNYLDQMTKLLVEDDSSKTKLLIEDISSETASDFGLSHEERLISRAITLNTLRQLHGDRKGQVLKFLYEAGLIGEQCQIDLKTLKPVKCLTQEVKIDLNGARLEGTSFEPPVPLQGIDLTSASLVKAKLQGINLARADMQRVTLTEADLSKAILTDAQMQNAYLINTVLVDASLSRAKFEASVMINANLSGANLDEAELVGADLQRANLSHAILTKVNLQGAKLQNANLEQADLSDADLQAADLRNANLSKVAWRGANFRDAIYNADTKLPDGLNPINEGMRQQ